MFVWCPLMKFEQYFYTFVDHRFVEDVFLKLALCATELGLLLFDELLTLALMLQLLPTVQLKLEEMARQFEFEWVAAEAFQEHLSDVVVIVAGTSSIAEMIRIP